MNLDRRINKSKHALKDALLVLMEKSDFSKITVTEIVQEANLNRGTFYKHYYTKEDLLEELIDDVMVDLQNSYRAPYLNSEKLDLNELTSSKIKIFEHVYSHARFYRAIVSSNVVPGIQHKICHVLKELQRDDLDIIQPATEVDIEFITSYYAYALFGLIMEWIQNDFKYTPDYMGKQLLAILTYIPNQEVQLKKI